VVLIAEFYCSHIYIFLLLFWTRKFFIR